MSVSGILYLVNKATRTILYAGEVPKTYGNITGMQDLDYATLRDLETHFGKDYVNLGFLTDTETRTVGVSADDIAQSKAGAWELKWSSLDSERYNLIQDQRWRIDRAADEVLLGKMPTEDITPVLAYCQAIRDLTTTFPDPFTIVWPALP